VVEVLQIWGSGYGGLDETQYSQDSGSLFLFLYIAIGPPICRECTGGFERAECVGYACNVTLRGAVDVLDISPRPDC
jgi:hypothetical protein